MRALVYHGPGRKSWEEGEQWARGITITTGLVDASSVPALMRLVTGGHLNAGGFVTDRFSLDEIEKAYDVFGRAAGTGTVKVALTR
jgi:alcohol dehydrogenase